MILDIKSYLHNPLAFISQYLAALGLEAGVNTEVRVVRSQKYSWASQIHHRVELDIDWKLLDQSVRRRIKRAVELEVPSYALGGTYKEPPMQGKLILKDEEHQLEISFDIGGAYVCEPVGEEEVEPNEYQIHQAKKLSQLTDEEILAQHRARIAELTKTQTKLRYRCKPS